MSATGLDALVDAPGGKRSVEDNAALVMLGGAGADARLKFQLGQGRRHTARISRWLALLRLDPPAGCATTLVWGLDARSVQWSSGLRPGDLWRGPTGFETDQHPLLWFRASPGWRRRGRAVRAAGVLEAGGLVDAAEVSARFGLGGQVALRMTFDTRMWGMSADVERSVTAAQPVMTVKASGVLRPFDMTTITGWQ